MNTLLKSIVNQIGGLFTKRHPVTTSVVHEKKEVDPQIERPTGYANKHKSELQRTRQSLLDMTGTSCLTWDDQCMLKLEPSPDETEEINLKNYGRLFKSYSQVPFKESLPEFKMRYPAIDPLFRKLCNNEDGIKKVCVRIFTPTDGGINGSFNYFNSFEKDPKLLSLSAKQILTAFVESLMRKRVSKSSFFVLNTKYPEQPSDIDDLNIVEIHLFAEAEKFVVQRRPYTKGSMLSGGIGTHTKFFVPVSKMVDYKTKTPELNAAETK